MLGLESLGVRMERHCKNALALAKYLESHKSVSGLIMLPYRMIDIMMFAKKLQMVMHPVLLVLG